ncbi:MAG: HAD-IC family P-type ATPase [Bacteroidetes bacterium]|nr:HAD-IC family P-type ATPase [Bacteroidota bacterium]
MGGTGSRAAPTAGRLDDVEQPWTQEAEAVVASLDVDPARGLSSAQVARRRAHYGPNQLREHQRRSIWRILLDQFKSLIIGLLFAAAVVAFAFGETLDSAAILAVIVISAAIGFVTEWRAVRSMEALFSLGRVSTRVRRDGATREIPADDLVPGDVVVVEGGDVITADLRLVESSKLQADESALTGESVPVGKDVAPVAPDAVLAERSSMLYKGTAVTRGAGVGVVVATGMDTELGGISALVEEAEQEATPLEKRLDRLGHKLIGVTLLIAAFVTISGVVTGKALILMIETGIALAVAAIPEGLPIVATIALARGMRRMARRNVLINRLSAVETLGATSVILTDKTGTLTENRMTATRLVVPSGPVTITGEGLELEGDFRRGDAPIDPLEHDEVRMALEVGVLCNDATLTEAAPEETPANGTDRAQDEPTVQVSGDPTEVALLVAGAKAGLHRPELVDRQPEVREDAFDPDLKMMATFHEAEGRYRVAVKGAPGEVLRVCTSVLQGASEQPMDDEARAAWLDRNDALAADGLRVLALATKTVETTDAEPYENLTFIGLIGLMDPPRDDVRDAIAACKGAGIRIVMVTGDQAITARGIGQAVGLVEGDAPPVVTGRQLEAAGGVGAGGAGQAHVATPIFARVSPRQKLDLIALHQQTGSVVAMTGDGVNDAPALKKADIGIAMGQRGTQVAREAADMVLQDDAFSSIVAAVEQGRVIFGNIRAFIVYLLSCNVSEVMVVGLASFIGMALPILPLQILFLNLVTDVFPALALGMGEGDPDAMERPPRDPKEPIIGQRHWLHIGGYGLVITGAVLGALALARSWLGMDVEAAVTVSFLTLAFAQLWHVFNMRDRGSHPLRSQITRNPYVWAALGLCIVLLLGAVYVPGISTVLDVHPPGWAGWGLVLGMSFIPLVLGQLYKGWGAAPESSRD